MSEYCYTCECALEYNPNTVDYKIVVQTERLLPGSKIYIPFLGKLQFCSIKCLKKWVDKQEYLDE